jgi:hypothetical protein
LCTRVVIGSPIGRAGDRFCNPPPAIDECECSGSVRDQADPEIVALEGLHERLGHAVCPSERGEGVEVNERSKVRSTTGRNGAIGRREERDKDDMMDLVVERVRLRHGNAKFRCRRPASPHDVLPIGAAHGEARERIS